METRSLFIRVSEFAAETSTSAHPTTNGRAIPIRVICGAVIQMMATHDESESNRQQDG